MSRIEAGPHFIREARLPVLSYIRFSPISREHVVAGPKLSTFEHRHPSLALITNLVDALEHRPRILPPPTISDTPDIPLGLPSQTEEPLDLRTDLHRPCRPPPEEGFNPIPIPRGDEDAFLRVVEGKSELSPKLGEKRGPMLEVEGDDQFGVGLGLEGIGFREG